MFSIFNENVKNEHKTLFICSALLRLYKCKFCNFTTNEKTVLLTHNCETDTINDTKCNKCKKCGAQSFSKIWSCFHRLRCRFLQQPHQFTSIDQTLKFYKCIDCDYKSSRQQSLNRHIIIKHSGIEKQFKCEYCSYATHTKMNIERHRMYKHTADSDIWWYRCDECSFKSKNNYSLKRHILNKHSSRRLTFNCTMCSFETFNQNYLKDHQLYMHTPEDLINWFKCEQCKYKTKKQSSLNAHVERKHLAKRRSFKCDKCSYETFRRSDLKPHVLHRHTPHDLIEWISCQYCNFKTKNIICLRKHMKRKHFVLEKKFKCEECAYRTHVKQYLKSHVKRHKK